MSAEMKRTWLVQRLRHPRRQDSPFAFGGGLRNGGLSSDAMDLLRSVWSFDYMGAAEFEFGVVPKALQALAQAADKGGLTTFEVTVPLADVPPNWRLRDSKVKPEGDATVYALCRTEHAKEVAKRIRSLAVKDYHLKESTRLPAALRPHDEWDTETVGWLELDNGFLFFTDREMFERAADLFGVRVEAVR